MEENKIIHGDALSSLAKLPDDSIHCCITSPPYYGLRQYGVEGQIGLEQTPEAYIARLVAIFHEVKRILRQDGCLWVVIGDSYARDAKKGQHKPGDPGKQAYIYDAGGGRASTTLDLGACGLKPKDLIGIPWMLAFALRADGWYLRSDICWYKPNVMPEAVTDRPTKAHEYVFLLTKSEHYYYNADAIKEKSTCSRMRGPALHPDRESTNGNAGLARRKPKPFRNRRSVWSINTEPFKGAHFAAFPRKLVEPCVKAGSPKGGIILDPFLGSGTTAVVALSLGRKFVGIELNERYVEIASARVGDVSPPLFP